MTKTNTNDYSPIPPPGNIGKYIAAAICALLIAGGLIHELLKHNP